MDPAQDVTNPQLKTIRRNYLSSIEIEQFRLEIDWPIKDFAGWSQVWEKRKMRNIHPTPIIW
jgi:hypothetical protein